MLLPEWFLILSLFLPRISLFVVWMEGFYFMPQPWAGLMWFFLPRVLTTIYIGQHLGVGGWFFLHLAFALLSLLMTAAKVGQGT